MKNAIKVICVIIGTIIGAGFASGREIYLFFNIYGLKGILGIVLASVLTGFIIYKVLIHIRKIEVHNYGEYLEKCNINKKVKDVMNIIINIFLLISFYIMIAGFCSYFVQEFNMNSFIISIIVCTMCYFTFINNIEGVTKINSILIPFLVILIIFIGIKSNILDINKIVLRIK